MRTYSSIGEIIVELGNLSNRAWQVKQGTCASAGIGMDSMDTRLVAMDGIQADCLACGWWMRTLMGAKRAYQEKIPDNWEAPYLEMVGVGPGFPDGPNRVGRAEDVMLNYLRNTITTSIQFKLESMFKRILRSLPGQSSDTPRGYERVVNTLLTEVGLSVQGDEKKTLKTLANLRNSYHSNGIHRGESFSFDLADVHLEFHDGEKVKCASWHHLLHLLGMTIKVVGSMLSLAAPKLPHGEIKDDFATLP